MRPVQGTAHRLGEKRKSRRALLTLGVIAHSALISPHISIAQTATAASQTRVDVDEENDTIRFYIKGALAAMLDESGLHVSQNVNYGGIIADKGDDVIGQAEGGNKNEE